MAFIPILVLAVLCLAALVVVAGVGAIAGSFWFLKAHPRIRAVVAPLSVVIMLVVGVWAWARPTATANWDMVARRLEPTARKADPLKEKLSPFSNYVPYARGYEAYKSLKPGEREAAAYEAIDRLAGVPDRAHQGYARGYARGSSRYDANLSYMQSGREQRHILDYAPTLIAVQGACLNAILPLIESPNITAQGLYGNQDLKQAEAFLARRTREGYPDASRDLALLYSKLSPEPNTFLTGSACRRDIQSTFGIEDADCDRYDPLKGSGVSAFLYRQWTALALKGLGGGLFPWS
jgi:hypothetical protein